MKYIIETLRTLLLIAIPLVWATPVQATWGPYGTSVGLDSTSADAPQIAPDGQGGAFILWRDTRSSELDTDVYAQRLTANGGVHPSWPLGGMAIASLPRGQNIPGLAADGQGGLFVAWSDARCCEINIYAQHLNSDGTVNWNLNGVPVTDTSHPQSAPPSICADQMGGAYVAWHDYRNETVDGSIGVYVQRLLENGNRSPEWPTDGLPVLRGPGTRAFPIVLPDGAGGAMVFWVDCRHDDCGGPSGSIGSIYMQRFRADGTIEPGWPEGGRPLAIGRGRVTAILDGAGGFYVATSTVEPGTESLVHYLHRLTLEGTPMPGWPSGGVVVCDAPGTRDDLHIVPDELGGVLLVWSDTRPPFNRYEIYSARVLADGTLAPGWPFDGLRVSNELGIELYELDPSICPDGFGGAYVAWERAFDFESPAYIQHLTADGQVAPDWPMFGLRVAQSSTQFSPEVASDGAHGAIVTWWGFGIYANRFGLTGPVSTAIALASSQASSNVVNLRWHAVDADRLNAWVERSDDTATWIEIGRPESEGRDMLHFEDLSVVPGARYGYRLAYFESGERHTTEATWLDIPGELTFVLDGFRPNPARGVPIVAFTLPDVAPATLELVDVRGRVLARRSIEELGAGAHTVRFDFGDRLAPGMYWIRLTQGARQLVRRGVVIG